MNKVDVLEKIDVKLARSITREQFNNYQAIPWHKEDESIKVLSTNEGIKVSYEYLLFLLKQKIQYEILDYSELVEVADKILRDNSEDDIINKAIEKRVSDIHFEPKESQVFIRFRVNGSLTLYSKMLSNQYETLLSRIKIKGKMDISEKRLPQDGKMIFICNGEKYNCRLSTIPIIYGEKLVIRIIYNNKLIEDLKNLNFSSVQYENLKRMICLKSGMVLVCGPTGSGKSSTLYSILNHIQKQDINITTIEDPVELELEGINQININDKIGMTFSEVLRAILRQDPDVIMLGEIRDELTAKIAIRAAITGHKVYATLHTKSPREAYLRLEEMGIQNYLLKDAICGIVSQRLIKVLCDDCKKQIGENRYVKCGCNNCNNSGYSGRILISSTYYIDNLLKHQLKNIDKDSEILNNKQMLEVIKDYLQKGKVDYYDYKQFIFGEELNEI